MRDYLQYYQGDPDGPVGPAAKSPHADDEGNCIRCDGSGHDQDNDGQMCRACGGAGNFNDEED